MRVLLLLSLLVVSGICQTYWPFDYFGYGYDLLTDEPTAPVIRLSFSENREWRSGVTGLLYQLPDEVEIMDFSESGLAKVVDLVRNLTEYQHAASSWHNFGISFFGLFGFQFSKESADVKKLLVDGKYVLYVAYKQFQFFELASWPYSILNQSESHFSQSLLQLPETYQTEQDRLAYSNWIGEFGTSYFERARYGGDIKYYIQVSSELLLSESEEWVSFQVGLFVTYMDIQFGFDYGRNISRVNISEKFWENAHAYCRFRPFGDDLQDCSNLTSIGFHGWVGSAMQQPVLLAPSLRNISDLIADDDKRRNMEQAIVLYLNTPPPNNTVQSRNHTTIQNLNIHKKPNKPIRIRADDSLPLIPGYNIIGMGLDAAKMEYTVIPIVPLTIAENQTYSCTPDNQYGPGCWQNPFYPDYNFFIPWNVYLENTPNSNLVNGSQVFQSYDDFQSYYSHTTSHHSFFGSKSKTVSYFYEKYFEEDSALVFQYQSRSWYQLTLPPIPPPQLHPTAAQVIAQLPSIYDPNDPNSVRLYFNAIQNLGTHFIYSAMYGGTQQMTAWFHKCMLSTYSMSFVEEQSGWSFFGIISDDSGKIDYNSKLNVNFTQWSSVQVDYTGGKAFAYEPSDFDEWTLTLKDRPVPTTYQVMPISMIIPDSDKSASYESAVKDYLQGSYNAAMQFQQTESQKDPWTKPDWCHWTPPKERRHVF